MTNPISYKLEKANQYIKNAENILLLTHHNPDGDGLSSLCAMAEYLNSLQKNYFAFCYNQPPKVFDFLVNIEKVNYLEANKGQDPKPNNQPLAFKNFDLVLVFDCGSLSRTKLGEEIVARRPDQIVIEFDHHPKIDDYADLEIRNHQAAATAEIIFQFFKVNNLVMNKSVANALLTGLITDTANFLYPSATETTIAAASELIGMGAQLPMLTDYTLRNKSLDTMKLWGKIMSSLQINPKYNFAFAVLSADDFKSHQIEKEELEGISGFLSNLYGVKGIMFLREEGDGIIRGSLRTSQPDADMSKLATLLGGGGHAKASGFSIPGKLVKTENGWKIE